MVTLHSISSTAILVNEEGNFLITKRSENLKNFAGKWTVPGGKLEVLDYVLKEKDTSSHWYNILENLVKKEVIEEVGLDIKNIGYVTSMIYIRSDKIPTLIVSLWGEPVGGDINLCKALTDYKWVDLNEAKNYDLIEGIYEELEILDKQLKDGKVLEWRR